MQVQEKQGIKNVRKTRRKRGERARNEARYKCRGKKSKKRPTSVRRGGSEEKGAGKIEAKNECRGKKSRKRPTSAKRCGSEEKEGARRGRK